MQLIDQDQSSFVTGWGSGARHPIFHTSLLSSTGLSELQLASSNACTYVPFYIRIATQAFELSRKKIAVFIYEMT